MYAIALAADRRFSEQVVTTLKSVCYHNRNLRFYLLNRDFPGEWFACLNAALQRSDCELIDVKIRNDDIRKFATYPHISDATYFRYFIPEWITEETVLYLDCDVVVNSSLQTVFEMDLGSRFVVAATDHIAETVHGMGRDYFNAGVMLINNCLWKQENICRRALELTGTGVTPAAEGDQGVLNYLFAGRWLRAGRSFNYQVGIDFVTRYAPLPKEDLQGNVPLIVHYNTEAKPWLAGYEMVRFRELYWHYWGLDWAEIAARCPEM